MKTWIRIRGFKKKKKLICKTLHVSANRALQKPETLEYLKNPLKQILQNLQEYPRAEQVV